MIETALVALTMFFATVEEQHEAESRKDLSVFPLATPLIAGPGALGTVILLMTNAEGSLLLLQATVIAALLVIMLVQLAALILASRIGQLLGVTGMQVINRILGVLLAALAVQFMFDGISQSGLLAR